MNILPATMAEGGRATLADGRGIALPPLAAAPPAGTPLSIGIRPEDIAIGDAPGALPFIISFVERLGKADDRSEEHTSELQSLMRISYAVFCLKKKTITQ